LLHVAVGDVTGYWLCWMETGQMWIYILWTLCGLLHVAVGDVTCYWLCWMESGQMWIYILWTLCRLFNWKMLCHFSVQRENTVKNSSHCHNGIGLSYGYTSWWIHCTMYCL